MVVPLAYCLDVHHKCSSSADAIAARTPETLLCLREKHPSAHDAVYMDDDDASGTVYEHIVSPQDIRRALLSISKGSSGVRHFMAEQTDTPRVLLKLDFKNAFNSIRRDKLMVAAKEIMPEYLALIKQMYRNPTQLFYGDDVISSKTGVQQGDPLGPVLFCLVIRSLTMKVHSPLNIWYLDDDTIGGEPATVLQDLEMISNIAAELGLALNLNKCEILVPHAANGRSQRDITQQMLMASEQLVVPGKNEWRLLGAPLNEESVVGVMEEKTAQLQRLSDRLSKLPAHQSLFLLKNCFAIPKVYYLLRTSPTWLRKECLQRFDNVIRQAVTKITNTKMTDEVWRQANLPVRCGGLGIRTTEQISLPAFIASVYSVMPVVSEIRPTANVDELLMGAVGLWSSTGLESPSIEQRVNQREWDNKAVSAIHDDLLATQDLEIRARLQSASAKGAGAWLNALQSAVIGNLLGDDELRISVALRLGGKVCEPHTCRCGAQVDALGQHGLNCTESAGRFARHGALNDVFHRSLVSAGIPSIREPNGLFSSDEKRQDGKTMVPYSKGKCMAWDVTVVDSLAMCHLISASQAPGKAAEDAEQYKRDKYAELELTYVFCPIGFETFGAAGPSAQRIIKEIVQRLADRSGETRSAEFLRQRISIEIQRGNAACVKGTLPKSKEFDEIFNVLSSK